MLEMSDLSAHRRASALASLRTVALSDVGAPLRRVECTVSARWHGCPNLPFEDAAVGDWTGNWPDAAAPFAGYLDWRAREIARWRVCSPRPGHNGPLARLEAWQITSDGVLRLRCAHTNYLTLLTTSGVGFEDQPKLRELCVDRMLDRPASCLNANHLNVLMLVGSADGYLMLSRRGRELGWAPGLMSTTAGGLVDCPAGADTVDVVAEGLRETEEEFGAALGISAQRTSIAGLFLSVEFGNIAPWLLLRADSSLTFEQLADRHRDPALGPTAAWEADGELVGLSTRDPQAALRWLVAHEGDFCRVGAASVTVALWAIANHREGGPWAFLGARHPPSDDRLLVRAGAQSRADALRLS